MSLGRFSCDDPDWQQFFAYCYVCKDFMACHRLFEVGRAAVFVCSVCFDRVGDFEHMDAWERALVGEVYVPT